MGAGVGLVVVIAVTEPVDDAAHRLLRVVLDVAHVGLHHVQPEVRDHRPHLVHALRVRGHLGAQVREVGRRVAGGVRAGAEQGLGLRLAEAAALDEQPVVEEHALLRQGRGERRHRARRQPTDLGVVAAGGHEEQEPGLIRPGVSGRSAAPRRRCDGGGGRAVVVEHRRHHGDVRQVGATVVRVVDGDGLAGAERAPAPPQHLLHGCAHRAEVHRHVRGVGDEVAGGVEEGAGEVEALLDVDGLGGRLEARAHLLGHGHEQVVEDLEHHRIRGGGGIRSRRRARAVQPQRPVRQHDGAPPLLDHRGRVVLGDDRGALHMRGHRQALAPVQRD